MALTSPYTNTLVLRIGHIMKASIRFFYLLSIFLLVGCHLRPKVSISGTTTGVESGVVSIVDENGQTVNAGRINNNRFDIERLFIKHAGYYTLVLAPDRQMSADHPIYLETGTYTINFANIRSYPTIASSSKTQIEISAYYAIKDSLARSKTESMAALKANLNKKMNGSNPEEPNAALNKLANATGFSSDGHPDALDAFIQQYPDSKIAAHLMTSMPFENDPEKYNRVYNKFNAYSKQTSEGKEIGDKLAQLIKLKEGAIVPEIAGVTPQGDKVDLKKLNTKLILVEFWRAGSAISRLNHQEMLANPFDATGGNLSIVSVSFDTKRDWWLTSVKDDKIKWTQVSDLKGDDSPNAKNWAIEIIPTYYLLDRQGRIIEREIPFSSIKGKVDAYVATHPN